MVSKLEADVQVLRERAKTGAFAVGANLSFVGAYLAMIRRYPGSQFKSISEVARQSGTAAAALRGLTQGLLFAALAGPLVRVGQSVRYLTKDLAEAEEEGQRRAVIGEFARTAALDLLPVIFEGVVRMTRGSKPLFSPSAHLGILLGLGALGPLVDWVRAHS